MDLAGFQGQVEGHGAEDLLPLDSSSAVHIISNLAPDGLEIDDVCLEVETVA